VLEEAESAVGRITRVTAVYDPDRSHSIPFNFDRLGICNPLIEKTGQFITGTIFLIADLEASRVDIAKGMAPGFRRYE
jgi:hypothetical protein